MPASTILTPVENQYRKPKGIIRRAIPPVLLLKEDASQTQIEEDIDDFLDTPPLELDSDASDETPSYVKFVFEDINESLLSAANVFVTEDKDGAPIVEIPADNPLSQSIQHRPFDYEPFSDPSFPFNFTSYSDELSIIEERLSDSNEKRRSSGSEMIALALVARVSTADSETDVFPTSLDRPLIFDLPVEVGSKLPTGLIGEDIDWELSH
jgi:hypothetical protein